MDKRDITKDYRGYFYVNLALVKGYISEIDLPQLDEIVKIIRTLYPENTEAQNVYMAIDFGGNIAKLKEHADKACLLPELDLKTISVAKMKDTAENRACLNDLETQKKAAIFGQEAAKVYDALMFAREMEKIS